MRKLLTAISIALLVTSGWGRAHGGSTPVAWNLTSGGPTTVVGPLAEPQTYRIWVRYVGGGGGVLHVLIDGVDQGQMRALETRVFEGKLIQLTTIPPNPNGDGTIEGPL